MSGRPSRPTGSGRPGGGRSGAGSSGGRGSGGGSSGGGRSGGGAADRAQRADRGRAREEPGRGRQGDGTAGRGRPTGRTAGRATRDNAKPDSAKPDRAKPDRAKPDRAKPDSAKLDRAKPDRAKPGSAKKDGAKPDSAKPSAGQRPAGRTRTRKNRWGKDAEKYLLPDEPPIIATRRHWAALFRPAVRGVPFLLAGIWFLQADPGDQAGAVVGLAVALGAVVYLALNVAEWWVRHLLITRRRVLLTSGVIIRTVAVMPVRRITDLTFKETLFGQLLGYGTFRFESAGQDQGLDVITYVPNADAHYRELSQLMFPADFGRRPGADEDDGTGGSDGGGPSTGQPGGRDRRGERDTAPIPRVVPPPDGRG